MPGTRKLSRTTSHRNAMLNNLVTSLILNGRVETTLAKAKEVKPLADSIIDLAVKEKDNFEMKEKTVSRAKLDKNGKKVKETKTSKNGNKYEVVVREVVKEEVKVDSASKLAARRKMFKTLNKVKDAEGKNIDIPAKLFGEIAENYKDRVGGYTSIIKMGPRRGDAAERVILKLV